MANLDAFKCHACVNIPDISDVYVCDNHHLYCLKCAQSTSNSTCQCSLKLKKVQNPLEYALQNCNVLCNYKNNGCAWQYLLKDRENHEKECKYRPYSCIGKNFGIFNCAWKGLQTEFKDHFKNFHKNLGDILSHKEDKQKLPFLQTVHNNLKKIHLIDAFNKIFVLYYEMEPKSKSINIIIYLLGTKKQSNKYVYELEIFNPVDEFSKIKFNQTCYNDTDDISELMKNGKCINVRYHVINNFIRNNHIYYRFRMMQKEKLRQAANN